MRLFVFEMRLYVPWWFPRRWVQSPTVSCKFICAVDKASALEVMAKCCVCRPEEVEVRGWRIIMDEPLVEPRIVCESNY